MIDQPEPAPEDLTGVWLPDPPICCLALTAAGPQDGRGGGQDGPGGGSADTEPSRDENGPQTGAGGLHTRLAAAIATAILPVIERETAQLRAERDMALNAAREARAALERGKS